MTEIEVGYVAQGYQLPERYTWELVHSDRVLYKLQDISVPLCLTMGVVAWGVPMKDGKFLTHP